MVTEIISDDFVRNKSYTKRYSWHEIELTVYRIESTRFSYFSSSIYIHDNTITGSSPPFSIKAINIFWKEILR